MLHEFLAFLTGVSVILSGVNTFNTFRLMVSERDRTDRYVSALLHKEGEYAAAKAVHRGEQRVVQNEEANGVRPRQIGLTAR